MNAFPITGLRFTNKGLALCLSLQVKGLLYNWVKKLRFALFLSLEVKGLLYTWVKKLRNLQGLL